jgi:threonine/homoserine/homoserine lactone efflux protein
MLKSRSCSPAMAQNLKSVSPEHLKGTLSSILNPKALLFCSVLLPQFVLPQAGSMGWQIAELGIVLVALGVIFDVSLALCAVSLSRWLRKHPHAQALQRWTFSAVLLAFAVRLSTD